METFDEWYTTFFAESTIPMSTLRWAYETAYKAGYGHGLTVANALWSQRDQIEAAGRHEEET